MPVRQVELPGQSAQRGQALIELTVAIVIGALFLAMAVNWLLSEQHSAGLSADGQILSQFGVGLRGYISDVEGGVVTLPSNPYTATGVTWLKPPSCGGLATNPTAGFIPCAFDGGSLGTSYSTTITNVPASGSIQAITNFFVPSTGDTKAATRDAAELTMDTLAQQTSPANGTFLTAWANTPLTATAQTNPSSIATADRGRVMLIVSNAASNDIYLRVDGTNEMLADLNVGGHSIDHAVNGTFTGSVHVSGTEQIDDGLSVTKGTAELSGGTLTTDVQLTSVDHMASQAIYNAQVYTGATSYTIPMPDCSTANAGTSSPGIYAALQSTGSPVATGGDALYNAYVKVVASGSNWIVTPVVETASFSLGGSSVGNTININLNKSVASASPSDQAVLVMTKCK